MKKVLKVIFEPIVYLILLGLFCLLFPNQLEAPDVIFYLIPTLGGFLCRLLVRSNPVRKILVRLKYYISQKPIVWSFSGEYVIKNGKSNEIINTCKTIIEDIAIDAYGNNLVKDISTSTRLLAYLSGVRIDIKYAELLNSINIQFISESPMKTFVRQHYNELIQTFFDKFEQRCGILETDRRITLKLNRVEIPICSLNEEENITNLYIDINEKKSKVSYQNGDFTCISNDVISCYNAFTKYILVTET